MFQRIFLILTLAVLLGVSETLAPNASGDEGMHPISQIAGIGLKEKGLQLDTSAIFNSETTCLVDGICRVNGCTGSFVSNTGLIITNHHCAYGAIQQASSTEHDYLQAGFVAANYAAEIPAQGYVVRVTESFEDVSEQMLAAVNDAMDFTARTKALERRQKELEKQAEDANPGMRAEVAEMFTGKTYVRFLYTYVKDVRLVFAPPESVGRFGGDADNWEWPRHTGDFSFMRAYVAPDGSSADFSTDNVPYQPKRFIQVAAEGVAEGDFVMLLGYPGRTARHKTARYLRYLQENFLPVTVDLYQQQIRLLEETGKSDRSVALKNLARIQGLANVEKRSRGQLKGLARTNILAERIAEEQRLQSHIEKKHGPKHPQTMILSSISHVYDQMSTQNEYELSLDNLRRGCLALSLAYSVYDAAIERAKPDLEREPAYMDRNFDQSVQQIGIVQKDFDATTDKLILKLMLERVKLDEKQYGALDIDQLYAGTKLYEAEFLQSCLTKSPAELANVDDTFLQLIIKLYPEYLRLRELNKHREGELNQLYGDLVTIKQDFQQTSFIPDANGTLRLTHGTVRGYSPADAITMAPFTTLSGVIAKTTGVDPFITPPSIIALHAKKEFGRFALPKQNDIPVAFLYDTDTTGGNSGSPVINARGELVGVNFDRTFEATINDFAWNTDYSRSIGVDIRYALWITGTVFGAQHLLDEMGVGNDAPKLKE